MCASCRYDSGVHEDTLLQHIATATRDLPREFPRVVVGPGDDCAVVRVGVGESGECVLLKTDQVVEGVHFPTGTDVSWIARKAIARPMSDIAAMAGRPISTMATVTLSRSTSQVEATRLADAVHEWGRRFQCPIVGGDIATFGPVDGPMVIGVSVVGVPHPSRGPVLRSGARRGDGVYVTGVVGGSFHAGTGGGRHLEFEPRVEVASALADLLGGSLHAMMDTSDGLGIDAGRLARASGVAIEIDEQSIPLGEPEVLEAIARGEDYELLFAADSSVPVPSSLAGVPITRIGRVMEGQGCTLVRHDGTRRNIASLGWEHHS